VVRNARNKDVEDDEEEDKGGEAAKEQHISTKILTNDRPFIASVK
jgi:hypothetical protein